MSDTTMIETKNLNQGTQSDQKGQNEQEQQVVAYLSSHADFFQRHPELLTELALSVNGSQDINTASSSSLLVKQVSALRERNVELRQRLNEFMSIAQENEALLEQTFQLSLNLFKAENLDDFFQALVSSLKDSFKIEHLHINLFSESFLPFQREQAHIGLSDIQKAETYFNTLLGRSNIFCGILREKEKQFLFPNQPDIIQSVSLIPLTIDKPIGIIALGSSNALHFQAKYGQTFLHQIQKISNLMLNKLIKLEVSN